VLVTISRLQMLTRSIFPQAGWPRFGVVGTKEGSVEWQSITVTGGRLRRANRVFRRPGIWTFSSTTRWPLPVARLGSSQRKASWASSLRALTGA
jgi:hypothetical protein